MNRALIPLRACVILAAACTAPLAVAAQQGVITPVPGSTAVPPPPAAPPLSLPPAPVPMPVVPGGSGVPYTTLPLSVDPRQLTQPDAAVRSQLPTGPVLTLADAERQALAANPGITQQRLLALAAGEVTRETRAAELPVATASLTAVDAHENSRVAAGALNNPIVYSRAAAGITGSALLTDFGRTRDLIRAAHLRADAATQNARATAADVLLAVDTAYFRALNAQTQLDVAAQTVGTREQSVEQIRALVNAKLRSTLDLSFGNVDLQQARLAQLDARNNELAALQALNALLGTTQPAAYALADPAAGASPSAPPADAEPLVTQALGARPDLQSLHTQSAAAAQFSDAERKLRLPSVSALGAAGTIPVRDDHILTNWYGAAGVNVTVPVFNGFLYDARAKEAALRAQAATAQEQDLRDTVARDVRQAVLEAQTDWQRIEVTTELLADAKTAYSLASTRYSLGLSNVVELSQAQLAETQAETGLVAARYTYQLALAQLRYQTGQ